MAAAARNKLLMYVGVGAALGAAEQYVNRKVDMTTANRMIYIGAAPLLTFGALWFAMGPLEAASVLAGWMLSGRIISFGIFETNQ